MLRAADHFADCVVGEKSTIASLVARFWDVQEGAVRIGGVDTVIGAKGIYVSGGERQRISIARAFLKDAPIILLDEAMASLDVDNETLIQSSLSKLIQNKTVLIIAHRMRTVANADQIVVLKEGRIAEHGSPKELIEKDGIFAAMSRLQTEGQKWTMA